MEITVVRKVRGTESTLGDLSINGTFECHTLEDVVREIPGVPVAQWKIFGKTAIPVGRYPVELAFSPHFQRMMLHIENIPGYAGVLIHKGNDAADTEGCILVGQIEQGTDRIAQSTAAFDALFPKVESALNAGEKVWIEVSNGF